MIEQIVGEISWDNNVEEIYRGLFIGLFIYTLRPLSTVWANKWLDSTRVGLWVYHDRMHNWFNVVHVEATRNRAISRIMHLA